jgi:cell division protein FtsQ
MSKYKLKRGVKIFIGVVILFLVIVVIENLLRNRRIGQLHIKITRPDSLLFIDTTEVKRLLTNNGKDDLQKTAFRQLGVKALENRVRSNLFVDKCEIARDLAGNLWVKIQQAKPIARFMREGKPDWYVDSIGKLMPISDRYTARVLLVTREKNNDMPDFADKDFNLLLLLNKIYRDKGFLRSLISNIHINEKREVFLYPQTGTDVIEFGRCYNIDEKLKRLRIFYKEVLPRKGWTKYKRVCLKYNGQIVCE